MKGNIVKALVVLFLSAAFIFIGFPAIAEECPNIVDPGEAPLEALVIESAPSSGKHILIYGPSMTTSTPNEESLAQAAGHTVTVADATMWSSYTADQFASFDAIVFGDPICGIGTSNLSAAEANKATWSAAVSGSIYLQGTDPIYHRYHKAESQIMIANGINYVAESAGTGLYVSLSCYYFDSPPGTPVSLLSEIGDFEVGGQEGCPSQVRIVDSTHPAMSGLTDAGLSNWGCSPHEFFTKYPANYDVLAEGMRPSDSAWLPFILAKSGIIEVDIDVKPGSYPNCFNINGHGVIPVAILGSEDFDVNSIAIDSLSFAGLTVLVRGKGALCHLEDVSGDFTNPEGAPDGYLDLVCQFEDDPDMWNTGNSEAEINGETLDGIPIIGLDSICVTQDVP